MEKKNEDKTNKELAAEILDLDPETYHASISKLNKKALLKILKDLKDAIEADVLLGEDMNLPPEIPQDARVVAESPVVTFPEGQELPPVICPVAVVDRSEVQLPVLESPFPPKTVATEEGSGNVWARSGSVLAGFHPISGEPVFE